LATEISATTVYSLKVLVPMKWKICCPAIPFRIAYEKLISHNSNNTKGLYLLKNTLASEARCSIGHETLPLSQTNLGAKIGLRRSALGEKKALL
jgi:hypothetical protein